MPGYPCCCEGEVEPTTCFCNVLMFATVSNVEPHFFLFDCEGENQTHELDPQSPDPLQPNQCEWLSGPERITTYRLRQSKSASGVTTYILDIIATLDPSRVFWRGTKQFPTYDCPPPQMTFTQDDRVLQTGLETNCFHSDSSPDMEILIDDVP